MKKWFNKNFKTIIITSFLIPILTIAIVSISHVTKWYEISNPIVWSQYLSFGIEIAALSSLAAISTNIGKKVYFPFILVTLVQFIGNVFYSYLFIDVKSVSFLSWVELVSPLLNLIGIEPTDLISHKRFLSFMEGGILPIISLSFLHMLVLYSEEIKQVTPPKVNEEPIILDDNPIDKPIIVEEEKIIEPQIIENNNKTNIEEPIIEEQIPNVVEKIEPVILSEEKKIESDVINSKYNEKFITVPSYFLKKGIDEYPPNNEDTSINDRIKASLAKRIINRRK